MKNERKQINRNVESCGNSRGKHSDDNKRNAKSKRPLDWDARDIKANTWIRGGFGRYENRYFEQDED